MTINMKSRTRTIKVLVPRPAKQKRIKPPRVPYVKPRKVRLPKVPKAKRLRVPKVVKPRKPNPLPPELRGRGNFVDETSEVRYHRSAGPLLGDGVGIPWHRGPDVTSEVRVLADLTIRSGFSSVSGSPHDLHPHSYQLIKEVAPRGVISWRQPGGGVAADWNEVSGCLRGAVPPAVLPDFSVSSEDAALSKIIKKLTDRQGQMAVTMAELHEVTELGGQALKLTNQFVQTFRSRRARELLGNTPILEVARLAGWAADMWLTYALAIKPTLGDLHDVLNVSTRNPSSGAANTPKGIHAGASKQVESHETDRMGDLRVIRSTLVKNRVHYSVRASVKNLIADHANRYGLLNPLSVGWELIPFSFVLDYFYSVGGYIETLGDLLMARENLEIEGTVTSISVKECTYSGTFGWESPTTLGSYQGSIKEVVFNRQVIHQLPLLPPAPELHFPQAASQLLTCASLLDSIGLKRFNAR